MQSSLSTSANSDKKPGNNSWGNRPLKKIKSYLNQIAEKLMIKGFSYRRRYRQDVQTWPRLKSCPFTPESYGVF